MAKGGRQPGAGRPKGSTNLPKIRDYFTAKEIEEMVEMAKTHMVDDLKLLMHLLDHIFGKAPQTINGEIDTNLTIAFDPSFNATARKTKEDR
jgi:hypothetical protein